MVRQLIFILFCGTLLAACTGNGVGDNSSSTGSLDGSINSVGSSTSASDHSSEPQSSSSQPVVSSSATSEASSSQPPIVSTGQVLYQAHCQTCHGDEQGNNVISGDALTLSRCDSCSSFDLLRIKIRDTMPFSDPLQCDNDCASDIADYIFANFDGYNGAAPKTQHQIVLEAEDASFEGITNPEQDGHIRTFESNDVRSVGYLGEGNEIAFYRTRFSIPGRYQLTVRYASGNNRNLDIQIGEQILELRSLSTGDFNRFADANIEFTINDAFADVRAGFEAAPALNIDKLTFTLVEEIPPEPISCSNSAVGVTPLQRLTRSEYFQSVKGLTGVDLTQTDIVLPADEKVSNWFNGNVTLPLTEAQFEQYLLAAEALGQQLTETGPMPEACLRISVNAAGPVYEPFGGVHYLAETYGSGGRLLDSGAKIPSTGADIVYNTARVGNTIRYDVPVPDGDYTVLLHFTELEYDNIGDRVFNVMAEGQTRLANHDIRSKAEKYAINNESFDVTVTGGELNLELTAGGGAPLVGGDQCNSTNQCQATWSNATDCVNSNSATSVCMCGNARCDAGGMSGGEATLSGFRITPKLGNETQCLTKHINEFAPKVFRRAISADERDRLLAVYNAVKTEAGSSESAYTAMATSLFLSPSFLYRKEGGSDEASYLAGQTVALNNNELANRLSFFLWGTTPDETLLELARASQLTDPDVYQQQVTRLLSDSRSTDRINAFYAQWLGVDDMSQVDKVASAYPNFSRQVVTAMQDDFAAAVETIYQAESPTLTDLLNHNYAHSKNPQLLSIFGVNDDGSNAIALPTAQRAGLLTHPAVMAKFAHAAQTSPVSRGVYVRNRYLCQHLPPPPPDVDDAEPELDPNATTKERFALHSVHPACQSCHNLIDPIGFAFENYDAVGAFRSDENGFAIDTIGRLIGTDSDGEFDDALSLAQILENSEQVQSCLVENWLTYALRRGLTEQDSCEIQQLSQQFGSSGGDLKQLLQAILLSDAFKSTRAHSAGN